MNLSAREVAAFTDGYIITGDPETNFPGVSTDSRNVREGELFIALRGEHFDGHSFIPEVLARGAAGIVVMEDTPRQPTVIISVEDTLQALGDIALGVRNRFDTAIVGVTGSTG